MTEPWVGSFTIGAAGAEFLRRDAVRGHIIPWAKSRYIISTEKSFGSLIILRQIKSYRDRNLVDTNAMLSLTTKFILSFATCAFTPVPNTVKLALKLQV